MSIILDKLLPLPVMMGVGVTGAEKDPTARIPTVITRFEDRKGEEPLTQETFLVITGANISVSSADSDDDTKSDVTFTVIHDCGVEGCPVLTGRLRFTVVTKELQQFQDELDAQKSFLWVCTTPTFQGKAMISRPTSRVATQSIEVRQLQ